MKYSFLLVILLFLNGQINAQVQYESPHVKDGKTMQYSLPSGYFLVENSQFYGNAMFSKDTSFRLSESEFEIDQPEGSFLMVSHETNEENGLEAFLAELKQDMKEFGDGVQVIDEPHIEKLNGNDCLMTAVGKLGSESDMERFYLNASAFGRYIVVFYYIASSEEAIDISYADFKKIMASGKEITTYREDGMSVFQEEMEEIFDEAAERVIGFQNDLFETGISYYDVLPDAGGNWSEPAEENSHLLTELIYKEDNGSVKVFSGGAASDYPEEEEMIGAIQQAMEWSKEMSLEFNTKFSNEDHVFKLYTISGGGTMTSVYTTEVNDELVFFVIDGGNNPSADFKPAVRDLMLTMWVDFVDIEVEEAEKVKN